jgi:hypothetical protein
MGDGLCVGGWGIGNCGSEGTKAQTQYNQTMNQLCSSTAEFIQSQSSSTSVATFNAQTMTLQIGGDIGPNCDITQSQSIDISQSTTGNLEANQCTTMGSDISTAITNMITQNSDATAGMLGGASSSGDITNLNTDIQNIVKETTKLESYQSILSQTFNTQDVALVVGGSCNGKITQSQKIVANVIAMNVLKAVQTALVENKSTSNVFTQLSQTATAKSEGLGDLVNSFFNGVAKVLGVPFGAAQNMTIACVVLLCLCCMGFLAFALSPAGQQATTTAANTGSSIAKSKFG